MYIIRWLMGRPIIAILFLAAIALLLNYNSGSNKTDVAEETLSSASLEKTVTSKDSDTNILASSDIQVDEVEVDKATSTEKHQTANVENILNNEKLSEGVSAVSKIRESEISHSSYPNDLTKNPTTEQSLNNSVNKENSVENAPTYPKDVTDSTTNTVAEIKAQKQINKVSNKPISNTVITADLENIDSEELLLMAREAYWNNGLDEAAQIYKRLIEVEPMTIGYRGELGNVYWRQGYPKKAAELYSEISIPMIEQGESDRVANMIGFIGLFYPDRAAEIHRRLQLDASKTQ